ncbi:MAG: cytochrome c peroxidase [Methylococcales bacterium]
MGMISNFKINLLAIIFNITLFIDGVFIMVYTRTTKLIFFLLALSTSPLTVALTTEEKLGKKLFKDISLSIQRNQSCESCHSMSRPDIPTKSGTGVFTMRKQTAPGFVDSENVEHGTSVSNGSLARKFGSLNAPSVGYAGFSPEFHWDGELFIGGQFWNGRAKDLVEQAKGPFLNPAEMAMPTEWSVIERLQENKKYISLFKRVYKIKLKNIKNGDAKVSEAFEAMAKAIAAFEKTRTFNRFDSKFDYEAAGITKYNASEQRGADLFDGDAQCGLCHSTEGISGEDTPALLTDFSYDNLGVPFNPQIPGNPDPDPGLLGNPNLDSVRGEPSTIAEVQGRQKVMTLRNIELTAPYMHNGVFKTLEEVVHFYNTRDKLPTCNKPSDATNPGFGTTCWPEGEFHATRNVAELGNLGLSEQDEVDLVAYLKTFTDNYPKWGNRNGRHDPNVPKRTPSPFAGFRP